MPDDAGLAHLKGLSELAVLDLADSNVLNSRGSASALQAPPKQG